MQLPPNRDRTHRRRRLFAALLACFVLLDLGAGFVPRAQAEEQPVFRLEAGQPQRQIYEQVSLTAGLPWQAVAAIDRYEYTLNRTHPKTRKVPPDALVSIYIPETIWAGLRNPDPADTHPLSIL